MVAKAVGIELREALAIFILAVWERLKDVGREEAKMEGSCVSKYVLFVKIVQRA